MPESNRSGRLFERIVETIIKEYGWPILNFGQHRGQDDFFRLNVAIRQHPYKKFYGGEGRCDYVFSLAHGAEETWLELKAQDGSGSVDEKLFCTYLNAIYSIPCPNIIIGVHGDGFNKNIIPFLRKSAERGFLQPTDGPRKTIRILTLVEVQRWVRDYLKSAS